MSDKQSARCKANNYVFLRYFVQVFCGLNFPTFISNKLNFVSRKMKKTKRRRKDLAANYRKDLRSIGDYHFGRNKIRSKLAQLSGKLKQFVDTHQDYSIQGYNACMVLWVGLWFMDIKLGVTCSYNVQQIRQLDFRSDRLAGPLLSFSELQFFQISFTIIFYGGLCSC